MAFLVDIGRASVWAVNALVGSATGGKVGTQEPPAKVVLVPPLFERDLRLRSRSAHPSGRPASGAAPLPSPPLQLPSSSRHSTHASTNGNVVSWVAHDPAPGPAAHRVYCKAPAEVAEPAAPQRAPHLPDIQSENEPWKCLLTGTSRGFLG